MKPKFIAGVTIGIVLIVVLLQNTDVVTLRFLFWKLSMSRIILLPIVLCIGAIIGFLIGRKSWDW